MTKEQFEAVEEYGKAFNDQKEATDILEALEKENNITLKIGDAYFIDVSKEMKAKLVDEYKNIVNYKTISLGESLSHLNDVFGNNQ